MYFNRQYRQYLVAIDRKTKNISATQVRAAPEVDLHEHLGLVQAGDAPGDAHGAAGGAGLHLRPRQRGQGVAGGAQRRARAGRPPDRHRVRDGEDGGGAGEAVQGEDQLHAPQHRRRRHRPGRLHHLRRVSLGE